MADDRQVLDLDTPQDGIVPAPGANLYEEELRRVVYRIRDRALKAKAAARGQRRAGPEDGDDEPDGADRHDRRRSTGCDDDCLPRIDHSRRGILIDAERGVGKTTFLRSICATVNDYSRFEPERGADGAPKPRVQVRVLPLLDPTLIDGDRVFLATVIANLLEVVERARGRKDVCDRGGRAKEQRFNAALTSLHAGLAASADAAWHPLTAEGSPDSRFIDQLLSLARGGISMADRFECFVRAAADVLDVDMFVQPIDDVDVAQAEAWTTLEVVRRYLSGPTLLPVVAANYPKLEAAVLQANIKGDATLLKALREDAEAHIKTTSYALHARLLDQQTSQYLRKLFLLDDRLQLVSKRSWVLLHRPVRLRDTEGPVPISPPAPPEDRRAVPTRSLLGDVQRALFASADPWHTEAAAALVPENTRALFDALRAMRRIATAGGDRTMIEAGLLELLDVHRDALAAAGLRAEDLARIVREGVAPPQAALVARRWGQLSCVPAAGDLRPEPVTDLLDAALTRRVTSGAAALEMMSRLFRAAGTLKPEDVQGAAEAGEQGLSWAGTCTAIDFRRSGGGDQLPMGLRLRSPDLSAEPGFVLALYERLIVCKNADEVDLFPYLQKWVGENRKTEEYTPKALERPFLTASELADLIASSPTAVHANSARDAVLALNLFGTRLVDQDAWIVDPARGLEALTHALQWGQQAETGVSGARSLLYRLVDLRHNREHGRVPRSLLQGEAEAVGGGANGMRQPDMPREVAGQRICEQLSAWIQANRALNNRAQARVLARIVGRWHRALGELTSAASARISTVGGFLESAVLSLLYAAAIEEVDGAAMKRWTLRRSKVPDEYGDAIFPLVKLNHPTKFSAWPNGDLASTLERKNAPAPGEPLLHLVQAVKQLSLPAKTRRPDATTLAELMPITHLLWSCPLLRLCLSGAWSAQLDTAVSVAGHADEPQDKMTAHDWLCAIPFFGEVPGEHRPEAELKAALPDWLRPRGDLAKSPAKTATKAARSSGRRHGTSTSAVKRRS